MNIGKWWQVMRDLTAQTASTNLQRDPDDPYDPDDDPPYTWKDER